MKTIGILGGMSWESTILYYRLMNEEVRRRLGGLHSSPILLHSVDFAGVRSLMQEERWDDIGRLLGAAGKGLARAGAAFLLIATNTMHKVAPQVEAAAGIPLLHIADPTGKALQQADISRIGLIGTAHTMRGNFYKGRMTKRFGIDVLTPSEPDMAVLDRIIFDELCRGVIQETSRREFLRVIETLHERGAEGIVLGCTEIGLLVSPEHTPLPLFDTTILHATAAVDRSLDTDEAAAHTENSPHVRHH